MLKDRSWRLGSNITQLSYKCCKIHLSEDRDPCGCGNHATQMLLLAGSILSLVYNVPLFLHMFQKRNEQLVIISEFISSFYLKTSQSLQPSQQTETQNEIPYLQCAFFLCFPTGHSESRLLRLSPNLFPSVLVFLQDVLRKHPTGPLTDGLLWLQTLVEPGVAILKLLQIIQSMPWCFLRC